MPEFDDTFLFDCAKFEKKKWKSYNIGLRPSSIVLKSVNSFSPGVYENSNNNNNINSTSSGKKYLLENDGIIVGGLRPIGDPNGDQVVLRKRDHSKQHQHQQHRNGAVSYLYSSVSPIREKILGYNFKRHSYSPGLFAAAASAAAAPGSELTPVPSFGECKYSNGH